MLKERLAVANKLANEVHAAEAAIDNAIAKLGVLVTSLPDAQAGARLSAVVGDRAFAHLQSAVAGLFQGRSQVVALHNELASLKDRVGLRNMVAVSYTHLDVYKRQHVASASHQIKIGQARGACAPWALWRPVDAARHRRRLLHCPS